MTSQNILMYRKIIYFCLGLGMSTPLLALVVGGRVISLTVIALILALVDLINNQSIIHKSFNKPIRKLFILWMNVSIIASLFGWLYFCSFDMTYALSSISQIPKILLYYLLFYLFSRNGDGKEKLTNIAVGVKYGILLNLTWAILDASIYYINGISLTNTIFSQVIKAYNLPYGQSSTIDGFYIRSAGLSNDQVNIGCFAISSVVYSFLYNKKWVSILGILACFASVSVIGIAGVTVAYMWKLFIFKNTKNRVIKSAVLLVVIILAYQYIKHSDNLVVTGLRMGMELRIKSKADGDESAGIRSLLVKKFPECVMRMPSSLIIGTGYYSVVYPYYQEGLIYGYSGKNNNPTAVENTFIEYFFDLGSIGLILFILMIYKITIQSYRNFLQKKDSFDAFLFSYMFGALFSYLLYHNILFSIDMFAYIAGSLYLTNKKIKTS